jgi:hypothetical protein
VICWGTFETRMPQRSPVGNAAEAASASKEPSSHLAGLNSDLSDVLDVCGMTDRTNQMETASNPSPEAVL